MSLILQIQEIVQGPIKDLYLEWIHGPLFPPAPALPPINVQIGPESIGDIAPTSSVGDLGSSFGDMGSSFGNLGSSGISPSVGDLGSSFGDFSPTAGDFGSSNLGVNPSLI
ncbi:hypothetical protein [Corynebacterium liangguodongii]|uniref:Uncharacterized protein n=1 Tax=Corynebacterium liangguodongii TaxID=2079535 RepID=A0A2S0WFP9_9CORY|nr:hypothetical protein [Corynebacterium liangguodongii]AWB84544.1 hypothetical protein C3E79_08650 [Corynebacterium liangguodongii]PWB98872.1 hypothetical protein DF219_09735 [Corynebacterium liangguodongii]